MAATRSRRVGAGAVLVIVLIIAALAISKLKHVHFPGLVSSGCVVHGGPYGVTLDTGQASIAATIAGVATHRALPVRAVTIAYATALQESDLEDLRYGDRDSVGVFQQRPSQGWGTRHQLLDPVYASTKFFAALAAIPDYLHLRIYKAAQAVQHSADGSAYAQYAPQGAAMAGGFSGRAPHAVWCWYGAGVGKQAKLASAGAQLRRTFGRLPIRRSGDPLATVRVRRPETAWAVAAWLVCHASRFGIQRVSYHGYQWTAAHGRKGWVQLRGRRDAAAARFGVVFG